ncbi:MAG: hypothetical protein K2Q10_08460, partial [Rhodospirillales bacterium]|nr:hypothetical protein [Rhodospirillales bacterium]
MDEKTTRLLTPERMLLALGAVVTVTLAVLGWYRLSYGFNFIDEGMYMADAWRMAAGDRLFPDNSTSVVRLYVVFNELIFRLFPDATLLFFRQLQYGLSLISMMAVAFAAWRWVRSAWVVVLALSLFAYTGLDPNGLPANLSYYVYPHAFLALHVALLLLALDSERPNLRVALLVASGTSLWAMGFSLLPLSAAAAAPVVLWGANRLLKAGLPFGRKEVVLVLAPVAIGWVFALALMGGDFFSALADMRRYFAEGDPTAGALSNEAAPYYAIIGAYLVLVLAALRLPGSMRGGIIGLLAVAFFAISDTNALGLIPYYWRGWFAEPMWLAALLGTGLLLTALHLAWRSLKRHPLDRNEQFLLAVLVPCALVAMLFSYFSGMGRLATNHTALLSTVLVAVFLAQRAAAVNGTTWLKAGVVLAALFPVY